MASSLCLRIEHAPATPTIGDELEDPDQRLLKKIEKVLDEKFASFESDFESRTDSWCQRQQELVRQALPRTDKQALAMLGKSETHVQTEFHGKEVSTQTDDCESLIPTPSEKKQKRKTRKMRTIDTDGLCLIRGSTSGAGEQQEAPEPESPQGNTSPTRLLRSPTKEDARKREPEAQKPMLSDKRKSVTDQGVDLLGNWNGKRTLQAQMDEVALKWYFARYTRLSECLARTDGPLSEFVRGRAFKLVSSLLVFSNIVFIVFEASQSVENAKDGKTASDAFRYVDVAFSIGFGIDLSFRLIGERASFFYSRDKWWNVLDLCLVMGDIVNEVLNLVLDALGKQTQSGYLGALRAAARGCRAGRAARTLRIFRSVTFLALPREIVAAINAVPFMILMYFFIALFFSLILMQATVEKYLDGNASASSKSTMNKYFGSVEALLASLFFTLLGGMDWIIIYNTLEGTSPLYSLIFLLFAFFAIVAFMNAVTAMCVQSCFKRAQQTESEANLVSSVKFMRKLNAQTQEDLSDPLTIERHDSACTWAQLLRSLDKPLVHGHLESLGLDLAEAKGICKLMARADSSAANLSEYARACVRFTRSVRGVDFLPIMLSNKKILSEVKDICDELRQLRAEQKQHRKF